MKEKRITIYDIAKELKISGSYVSRALNNHHTISDKMKELVKKKASELNYKHNAFAASLRQGSSKIIGIVIPKINESFFSNAIAGIEAICSKHKHHIIICQSEENFRKEKEAVDILIRQNVDGILISLSQQTKSTEHLQEVLNNNIHLIQFDRCDESFSSFIVKNDNLDAANMAVNHLLQKRYNNLAYIGGPEHLKIYYDRKQGFVEAMRTAGISIPDEFINNVALSREEAKEIAFKLLTGKNRPDGFFTASDQAALGVIQAATTLNISIPDELGIIGFQNEEFTNFISPSLSSIEQNSTKIGKSAANLYFNNILNAKNNTPKYITEVIKCELVERNSSMGKKKIAEI